MGLLEVGQSGWVGASYMHFDHDGSKLLPPFPVIMLTACSSVWRLQRGVVESTLSAPVSWVGQLWVGSVT